MRKKSIVQEFVQKPTTGILVMKEKTNFLSGKMMDIQDIVRVGHYFNLSTPIANIANLNDVNYDVLKINSIKLLQDETQSKTESDTTTKWIFNFNSKSLLREYLYTEIFTYADIDSPFKNINISGVPNIKLNNLCYEYINLNVLDRYKVKEFVLWTKYYKLEENIVPNSGTDVYYDPEIKLSYKNPVFSYRAIPVDDSDFKKEVISSKQYSDGTYEIGYKQTENSNYYTFIYYFDVIFEKI
jgi:hypothetical protein